MIAAYWTSSWVLVALGHPQVSRRLCRGFLARLAAGDGSRGALERGFWSLAR
ncbi:MAG: hypothetical protein QXJ21_02135 [Thermofilum sp.]